MEKGGTFGSNSDISHLILHRQPTKPKPTSSLPEIRDECEWVLASTVVYEIDIYTFDPPSQWIIPMDARKLTRPHFKSGSLFRQAGTQAPLSVTGYPRARRKSSPTNKTPTCSHLHLRSMYHQYFPANEDPPCLTILPLLGLLSAGSCALDYVLILSQLNFDEKKALPCPLARGLSQ